MIKSGDVFSPKACRMGLLSQQQHQVSVHKATQLIFHVVILFPRCQADARTTCPPPPIKGRYETVFDTRDGKLLKQLSETFALLQKEWSRKADVLERKSYTKQFAWRGNFEIFFAKIIITKSIFILENVSAQQSKEASYEWRHIFLLAVNEIKFLVIMRNIEAPNWNNLEDYLLMICAQKWRGSTVEFWYAITDFETFFCGGPKNQIILRLNFLDRENGKETRIVYYPIKPNMQKIVWS